MKNSIMKFYIAKDNNLSATPGYHLYEKEPVQEDGWYHTNGEGSIAYITDSMAESILKGKLEFDDGPVEIEIKVVDGKEKESSMEQRKKKTNSRRNRKQVV